VQIYKKKWANCRVKDCKFFILFISLSFLLLGCYKKKDTLLQVYVRDVTGNSIKGAKVEVFAEPTDTSNLNNLSINFDQITDENGIASFNFNEVYKSGQTGVAVLKAKATLYGKTGETIVNLIEEFNNECFIEIQ
jgi:hypothetical protein